MKIAAMLIGILIAGGHSMKPQRAPDSIKINQNKKSDADAKESAAKKEKVSDTLRRKPTAETVVVVARVFLENKDSANNRDQPKPVYFRIFRFPVGGTEITILITFLLAAAAYRLNHITRINGNKQLRAYIGLSDIERKPLPGGTEVPIVNYGQTPARDLVGLLRVDLRPASLTEILALEEDPGQAHVVLSPGEKHGLVGDRKDITDDMEYWAYGKITYLDVFDVRRATTFQSKVLPGDIRLAWKEGNTAT